MIGLLEPVVVQCVHGGPVEGGVADDEGSVAVRVLVVEEVDREIVYVNLVNRGYVLASPTVSRNSERKKYLNYLSNIRYT